MRNDLRHALRRLLATPAFAVTAVLTLALGVGANTAIFSVVNAVLLKPLPYPDASRLVAVEVVGRNATGGGTLPWAYPRFDAVRELSRTIQPMAAFAARPVSLTGRGAAERLHHESVSAPYFELLGAVPHRGRLFSLQDDDAAAPSRVAIISHGLWQRRFGADDAAVGAEIRLNDHAFTVIGVLPPGFRGMATGTDVWTPMAAAPMVYDMPRRLSNANAMWHQVMGRLHTDATVTSAAAELASLRAEIENRYPSPTRQPLDLRIRSLLDVTIEPSLRRSIWILFGAVGCVLLITAANLSNLLLTRATVYRRQLAIRRALGASRAALARVCVAEALLLATFGGALGMLLAIWGIDLLTSLRPEGLSGFWKDYARVVDADTVDVTAAVFAFNFGAALLTGLVFSLLPALQATRIEIADTLRGGAGTSTTVRRSSPGRVGHSLVVLQMASAIVLATGAGVMVQSFARLIATDLGARTSQLLTFRVDLPAQRYDQARTRVFQQELEQRLAALPGVAAVALANSLPVSGQMEMTVAAPAPQDPSTGIGVHIVSANYFRTFDIRLLDGRPFSDADYASAAPVALISVTARRSFFPDVNPIGRRLAQASGVAPEVEIIGIVDDVRYDAVEQAPGPDLYITNALYPAGYYYVVLRARGDQRPLARAAERALHDVDPSLPLYELRSMDERVSVALSRARFVTALLAGLATLALAIAGIGVYGVVSYTVGARVRDIGIRMALGARRSRVLREILLDTGLVGVAALIIGIPASIAATRVLAGMLYGVTPHDPATIAAVAVLVLAIAIVAAWQPARRAARTDPMAVLRHE